VAGGHGSTRIADVAPGAALETGPQGLLLVALGSRDPLVEVASEVVYTVSGYALRHGAGGDALVEAGQLAQGNVCVLRVGGGQAGIDPHVVDVALRVVALPSVGERGLVGPFARGNPLPIPARALAQATARGFRVVPGHHPWGMAALPVGVLVLVDAIGQGVPGALARGGARLELVAERQAVGLVVLGEDALPIHIGTEVVLHMNHVRGTGRRGWGGSVRRGGGGIGRLLFRLGRRWGGIRRGVVSGGGGGRGGGGTASDRGGDGEREEEARRSGRCHGRDSHHRRSGLTSGGMAKDLYHGVRWMVLP